MVSRSQLVGAAAVAATVAVAAVLYRRYKWRQGRFCVMSYNVLVDTKTYPNRPDSHWPNRKDLLIKQIRDRAPHLAHQRAVVPALNTWRQG